MTHMRDARVTVVGSDPINLLPIRNYLKSVLPSHSEPLYLDEIADQKVLETTDLLISCRNQPKSVSLAGLPNHALAIDFGYGSGREGPAGDFKLGLETRTKDFHVTTVPGGTGLILSTCLARNLYMAWKSKHRI